MPMPNPIVTFMLIALLSEGVDEKHLAPLHVHREPSPIYQNSIEAAIVGSFVNADRAIPIVTPPSTFAWTSRVDSILVLPSTRKDVTLILKRLP
jgi:hypothetical protein